MTNTDDFIATRQLHKRIKTLVRQVENKRLDNNAKAMEALQEQSNGARNMFLANPDSVDLLRELGITPDDLSPEPEEAPGV